MSERSDDDVLKTVLEGSPIGAAILDVASGKRLFVNSRLVAMFGAASADDLLNNDIRDTWVDPDAFTASYTQFSKGKLLVNVESERRRFDGTRWWVLMNTQPVTFENRKAGIVWHIDISDRKSAEAQIFHAKQEAEDASHAKSDFLAHVSHELRTPLNSILGFSQMLSTESATGIDPVNRIEYAKNIFASGGHLLGIINDILDLSKIEAGEFELDQSAFDINDVLTTAQQMMNSLAEVDGITLNYTPSAAPITLFADKRVVTQIIVNLLSNAIKFNNTRGCVTLAAAALPTAAGRSPSPIRGSGSPRPISLGFSPPSGRSAPARTGPMGARAWAFPCRNTWWNCTAAPFTCRARRARARRSKSRSRRRRNGPPPFRIGDPRRSLIRSPFESSKVPRFPSHRSGFPLPWHLPFSIFATSI
jgi:PAS domain S-box-containing protein